jgi:hypothetical protein
MGYLKASGKVLVCCGVALYLYVLKNIFFPSSTSSLKDSGKGEDTISDQNSVDQASRSLLVATRVHMKSASVMPNPELIVQFILSTQRYANGIVVCVGAEEYNDIVSYIDSAQLLMKQNSNIDMSSVYFLPVYPWGYFVTALNAAIQYAQDHNFDLIAFQVSDIL